MKSIGKDTYEHNGVMFEVPPEAVTDMLFYHGIAVFQHLEKTIDKMVQSNGGSDFKVRLVVETYPTADEVSVVLRTIKIP